MNAQKNTIYAVPTNIITGFLGVGKTTTILNLLKQKPSSERWAILVNEFGEVGVDGSLMKGNHTEDQGVFIREVPGGCMCCAAGLPMLIALNQLLSRAKPDRLLIEPTGLGHPKEVLELLNAGHYQDILNIQQCIVLVDARKLEDSRYTSHDTFNQQIDMADKVIGSKADLYDEHHSRILIEYVSKRHDSAVPVMFTEKGNVDMTVLSGDSSVAAKIKQQGNIPRGYESSEVLAPTVNEENLPESGYIRVENSGESYQSIGWRFSANKIFNRSALFNWLGGLSVERAKGVFITSEGVFAYNLTIDSITEMELDDCMESRIEIIAQGGNHASESDLLLCLES